MTPRDPDAPTAVVDHLEARLRNIGATTTATAPADAADPSAYLLFKGTSRDGTTEYLVHIWGGAGTAMIDARPAGTDQAWAPIALDLVEEVVR